MEEALKEFVRVRQASPRGKGIVVLGDMNDYMDPKSLEQCIASSVQIAGRVDILVNNAGILRDRMIYNMSLRNGTS
jgi:3-oxoacyl-[acyl-carrier protein] reductase